MDMCKTCKINPVKCKKTHECGKCYSQRKNKEARTWRDDWLAGMGLLAQRHEKLGFKGAHEREIQFAATFFGKHPFLYEPATFDLPGECFADGRSHRYTPDYYDIDRDTWIEVVGTNQAYSYSQFVYRAFRQTYPNLKFEIRSYTGGLYLCGEMPDGAIASELRLDEQSSQEPSLSTDSRPRKLPDSR